MRSYNKVILIGHVASEPEPRKTTTGTDVTSFPLAINRRWTDKTTGIQNEEVDYHRITCWSNLGVLAKENLHRGSLVAVEGRLKNNSYENEKGQKIFITEIIADDINILSWPKTEKEPKVENKKTSQKETTTA